ncbi:MAG: helix-turn-helix domain-containing protein [Micromonosporaceae bacterium]|nr:helix-turn-helix domain-containing protein [Micromonosporaceae bacterium]
MRSLARVMAILEFVASNTEGATIAEIAKGVDLHIATASRLVHTLREESMLEQNRAHRYVVGNRVLSLARKGMDQNELVVRARPYMQRLRDLTGETVSLHVPYEGLRVCIGEVRSKHLISRALPPGDVKPVLDTATGEVLLINHTAEELAEVLAAHHSKEDLAVVVRRVAGLREQGWSFVDTWVDGVGALSVPIDSGGRAVAALTVSGPSSRYTRTQAMVHLPDVQQAARQLAE